MITEQQMQEREQSLQTALENLKKYQLDLEAENSALRGRLRALDVQSESQRAASALSASAELDARFRELEEYMKKLAGSQSGDVTWLQGPEGPVVRIQDQVIFRSGSDAVSEDGRKLLAGLAPELAGANAYLRVEGHTDSDQLKVHAKEYPHGNLDLSAQRALEVASVLQENGVPADRIAVVGYGEHRPVAPNDTPEGKRRNRRVEIVILNAGQPTR